MTAKLATASFAPVIGTRPAPISAVAFAKDGNVMKILGRTVGAPLDLRPFAALFPRQVELAWAYAEWVDWLESSLLSERMSFDEFSRLLAKPSMQALKMNDVVQVSGNLASVVASRFKAAVHLPAPSVQPAVISPPNAWPYYEAPLAPPDTRMYVADR